MELGHLSFVKFLTFSAICVLLEGGDSMAVSAIQSLQQVQLVAAAAVTVAVRSD